MMPLPLPGSPSASWPAYVGRLRNAFAGADLRVCIAFWLFGLINNVLYVIILTAALDLVGPDVPKAVVLLADIIPSLLTKMLAPYFIHLIPYYVRVLIFVVLSVLGMLMIALTPDYTDGGSIGVKMVGVVMASLASGNGELSFVGMVHFYGPFSLAAWSSGTGGAGLIGAGAYAFATNTLGLSVKITLLASAFLPGVMLISFFIILPLGPLKSGSHINHVPAETRGESMDDRDFNDQEREGLLESPAESCHSKPLVMVHRHIHSENSFAHNLARVKVLVIPYMLPLFLVYFAEYTINQGVSPTLLFPLPQTPFNHYRAFYPAYNAIYQAGVFISRSSTPFLRVHNLYLPSFLQVLNLAILMTHSLFDYIPSVYIVFFIIFWEGLLGGLVYVNTFAEISDNVPKKDREFSLSATTVSDSGGICLSGFMSMVIEVSLCNWQVSRGRDWCKKL